MKKGRKIPNEQMNPAGQEEWIEAGSLFVEKKPVWFLQNGKVNPEWLSVCEEERNQTNRLLERIISFSNLSQAWKQVKRNKGIAGVDKQTIEEFGEWFPANWETLVEQIMEGIYTPSPTLKQEIPKANGKVRELGIPTVKDRVVQQAIQQVLQTQYDQTFSPNSYGFRPKRNAHQALSRASGYIASGKRYIIDLDLAKFFDEVNHHRLMWLLSQRIGDERLLNLIRKILKSGILAEGLKKQRTKGTPQGSPLSPLLSNIVLDELDQELQRRGLDFIRYADDVQIFVSSKLSAERVQKSLIEFIEQRMLLKVNREKSGIRQPQEANFLGYSFMGNGSLRLSTKSEERLKDKIKTITSRKRGVSFEQILSELRITLQGWLGYFKLAKMKSKLQQIDGWMRRRLTCFRLKQCKRAIGIARFLQKLGVSEELSWKTALSGKGWWRLSNSPGCNYGMTRKWFSKQGFYSLLENYEK